MRIKCGNYRSRLLLQGKCDDACYCHRCCGILTARVASPRVLLHHCAGQRYPHCSISARSLYPSEKSRALMISVVVGHVVARLWIQHGYRSIRHSIATSTMHTNTSILPRFYSASNCAAAGLNARMRAALPIGSACCSRRRVEYNTAPTCSHARCTPSQRICRTIIKAALTRPYTCARCQRRRASEMRRRNGRRGSRRC